MKVAVVGAGLAGLTCAQELARQNIEVEIFEKCKRNQPTRPRQMEGTVHFLKNIPKCNATREMTKLLFTSKYEKVKMKGRIGYAYEIGGKKGIEAILRKEVEKSVNINYDAEINKASELQPDFDIIVAADGYRSKIAKNMNMREFKSKMMGFGIGLTVKGNFDIYQLWGHYEDYYAEKGYTYLIPFDKNYATFASASIAKTINAKKIKERLENWAKKEKFEIVKRWNDFESWYNFKTYQKDDVYVIGQAGSMTEPTFGFGIKWAIKSGELCANAIINKLDFNEILKYQLFPEFEFWKLIRKIIDTSVHDDYSSFVRSFNNPIAKYYVQRGKYAPFIFKFAGWLKNIPVSEKLKLERLKQAQKFAFSPWARIG